MKKIRLLIVEDEREMLEMFREMLRNDFDLHLIDNGFEFLTALRQYRPHLVLLDEMLPGKSGSECLRELRYSSEFSDMPVIMVTGLSGDDDKVKALESGADDYITKPFHPAELIARIHSVLRRSRALGNSLGSGRPDQIELGPLVLDLRGHRALHNGSEVSLTLTEFNILRELLSSPGQVLSRERLRQTALGNLNVTDRTIDVHMASLRKKLQDSGERIETVRGVGYRLAHI